MKIAFFTPSLMIGGVERVFLTYAGTLSQMGHDIYYITCNTKVENDITDINIHLISLDSSRLRNSFYPLGKILKLYNFDFIISGGDGPNLMVILACKIFRIKSKIILSHHNHFNVERNEFLSKAIIRLFYPLADKTIAVSKSILTELNDNGVPTKKLETLYNPIDLEKTLLMSEQITQEKLPDKYILFLGRLGKVKNLKLLIHSFKILSERNQDLKLIFIGEGPEKEELVQLISDLNITQKVLFLGIKSNPFPYIKKALTIVLSSWSEALPTVIIESMILGKTVVSTPTLGATDLLENGRIGYISKKFDDPLEFADLIEDALRKPIEPFLLIEKANQFDSNGKTKELIQILSNT